MFAGIVCLVIKGNDRIADTAVSDKLPEQGTGEDPVVDAATEEAEIASAGVMQFGGDFASGVEDSERVTGSLGGPRFIHKPEIADAVVRSDCGKALGCMFWGGITDTFQLARGIAFAIFPRPSPLGQILQAPIMPFTEFQIRERMSRNFLCLRFKRDPSILQKPAMWAIGMVARAVDA